MEYELLKSKIFLKIKKTPSELRGYEDAFNLARIHKPEDLQESLRVNEEMRDMLVRNMGIAKDKEMFFSLYKRSLLFESPYKFDSYMLYLEINRKPQDRFYAPRRKVLKPLVDAMQQLSDNELDELFLSMPPRVGKTTILMFFVTWLIGRNSEASNLYSAYSDTITKAFYNGVLEIIQDPVTYTWNDVFPEAKIIQTNSQEETLNIDRRKRYPSLTCRSLYGTLNGACDCNGFEISDDLIGGIEEALNKDRMISAWSKVDNNLLPRAKEKAKILWCGTRWSIMDPAGLRMDLLLNDDRFKNRRFKIINLPALNESDESNFQYDYGVGFSTEYYQQRRASFEKNNDMASWTAQYMGEPIERDGALFMPEDMKYFNGVLPETEPDRIFCAVDPAFGGGDFVASPICYQYGTELYVVGVVYDNNDKKITQALLANAVKKWNIQAMQIEATKATASYKEELEDLLKKDGIRINMTTKAAPTDKAKFQRIFDKAPDIREMMYFLEPGKRDKAYNLFMQNVFSYKMIGKNKNDDAPDSLAMAIDMVVNPMGRVEIFKRVF